MLDTLRYTSACYYHTHPFPPSEALPHGCQRGRQAEARCLTDMHVDKMLFVLVDGPPHVCLALLVLVSTILLAARVVGGRAGLLD